MVRSPKSISGVAGLALANAPYQSGDRTTAIAIALQRQMLLQNVAESGSVRPSWIEGA
ncbi:hypothetical protein VL20_5127 [Microcystis aeruginosa 11-30S32]|uniref:Uncharacterized protein n=1 Tax=Microcystis aeruginosa 11-30S32 TaxID=2358142 RepID=A0A510PJR9_MICAE|nr:hypothetical protein VL20_5127 [Microcystis aeruginosa 11-30S32]